MRRYGGDLNKAKRIILIFCVAVFFLTIPLLLSNENYSALPKTAMPSLWIYGLILCPIILAILVNIAFRKFDRANR